MIEISLRLEERTVLSCYTAYVVVVAGVGSACLNWQKFGAVLFKFGQAFISITKAH